MKSGAAPLSAGTEQRPAMDAAREVEGAAVPLPPVVRETDATRINAAVDNGGSRVGRL
ncbi:hypothetical protein FHU13_002200 [Methylobacterium sp. R2-1]|nr:hypothetical protein [Methylobacterium sp. R2-1]